MAKKIFFLFLIVSLIFSLALLFSVDDTRAGPTGGNGVGGGTGDGCSGRGFSCNDDNCCIVGLDCWNGQCLLDNSLPRGDACYSVRECGSGLRCSNGLCCTYSGDCSGDDSGGGDCIVRGEACVKDGDPCCSPSDCLFSQDERKCFLNHSLPIGDACYSTMECGSRLRCLGGVCCRANNLVVVGGVCWCDEDCDKSNNTCDNNICVVGGGDDDDDDGGGGIEGGLINPLSCGGLDECINGVVDFVFRIAIVLAPLMIIIAGFLFVTAAGSPEKITQAKKIILWASIGFLIVSLSKAVMSIITGALGG